MDRKLQLVSGAMRALFCGLCLSSAVFAQNLPDGTGKAEFIHNCLDCHSAGMVLRAKKTPDEWRKSVDDMAARGSDGSKEDIDKVVVYLDKYFATDRPGTAATAQSPVLSSVSGGSAALNSSEIDRAKRVIAENGCLACHRVEKQGAYTGPTLNGLKVRRTTDEIRDAIVHPHATLDPSNNLIRLTTAGGKTVVGRILSQSDHDVRVIDASGEVATYSKPELRQFTILDTNPMVSYEEKIKGEDLDDLVRYLGSLPSVDESVQK
ncbi:c-type cytochrome [Tunturiibacter lichenicola]|jgi:putative heme-binding domain-containing protein|uniref:c-type cytochrome n=1 Tax=Tunturiibacter lichenicola TaxID=2051959 RepID=UPI003D9BD788